MNMEDENEMLRDALISQAKMADRIFLQYGVELEQFQVASRYFMQSSQDFEARLIQREAELMGEGVPM